ncbi:MAG: hypothetical protein K6F69_10020 [Treponema sp.]|nr:hypothetical protein [Treponema sp.]
MKNIEKENLNELGKALVNTIKYTEYLINNQIRDNNELIVDLSHKIEILYKTQTFMEGIKVLKMENIPNVEVKFNIPEEYMRAAIFVMMEEINSVTIKLDFSQMTTKEMVILQEGFSKIYSLARNRTDVKIYINM